MNSMVKRIVVGMLVLTEFCIIIFLCSLIGRQFELLQNKKKYAAKLPADHYYPQVKSIRYPHYYEPEANATINDHPAWLGYNASYSINADTFNERDDYSVAKEPDTFRIITLGDSFTYGLFVNTYENYTELLEDHLGNSCPGMHYEVINLGVPAYDVGYSSERYMLRGQKYNPDLVIWFMNPFTFEIDADRKVALENEFLSRIPESERWKMVNGTPEFYPGYLAWQQLVNENNSEKNIAKQVGYFREFLEAYHGSLFVVANQWELWPQVASAAVRDMLVNRTKTWIYQLDLLEPGVTLLADGHPNINGHKMIETKLFDQLNDHQIVNCRK